jgi:hypothetical protein
MPVLCGGKTFLVPVPEGFSEVPQDSRLFTLQQKIQEDLGNCILAYLKDPAHTVVQLATLVVFVTKELEGIEAPADAFKDWLRSQEAPADAATSTQELQDAVKNYKKRIKSLANIETEEPKVQSLGRKYLDDATYISQFIRWDSWKTPSGKVQQTCQLGTLVFLLVRGQMFSAGFYRDLSRSNDAQECLGIARLWAADFIRANALLYDGTR